MGWLFMPQGALGHHRSAKSYLDDQFTYEHAQDEGGTRGLRVLASACPQNRTWYAAAQITQNGTGGDIVALVCLVKWNPRDKEGLVFGYKSMDETVGPYEAKCPGRILDLLTPTTHPNAIQWRERCRENLDRRRRVLADGDRIRLAETVTFTDGHEGCEFLIQKRGRRLVLRDPETKASYRISRLMERAWTIVPATRVHKTPFA